MANEIDSNPYAAPESLNDKLAATEHDRFIVEQVTSLLKPKERVRMTACVVKTLPLRARIALVVLVGLCGVLTRAFIPPSVLPRFLIIPASFVLFGLILSSIYLRLVQVYLVAVTKRRMILIRAPLAPSGRAYAILASSRSAGRRWITLSRAGSRTIARCSSCFATVVSARCGSRPG